MSKAPKIIVVPIDNRPITYSFPKMVAAVAGIEALLPPKELLGGLQAPADLNELSRWLEKSLQEIKPQALFVCLDSLLYGGLTASRRLDNSFEEIMSRAQEISNWKKLTGNELQVYAQASIMRIPNYNNASAEPKYWNDYGQKIHQWSALLHKQKLGQPAPGSDLKEIEKTIPNMVRQDFLSRRKRNFQINQHIAKLATTGLIDYLVFSQDDTGQFGLNVAEKEELVAQASANKATNIIAYAGADEIVLTLMSRWLASQGSRKPKAIIQFSREQDNAILSNVEGQTIGDSVVVQTRAAGLEISDKDPDFAVIVHTAADVQGDHVWLPEHEDLRTLDTQANVEKTIRLMENSTVPIVLCDVAYTNGSDPLLIDQLLKRKDLIEKLWAYAGWNTTGNTVGSALALGIACWYAKQHGSENKRTLKKALFVRFADDWAYQTQVRPQLNSKPSQDQLHQLMVPLLEKLKTAMDFDPGKITLQFPWNRIFEVEIGL